MFKKTLLILITCLSILFVFLIFIAIHQSKKLQRDPVLLMDKYYRLKDFRPEAAQQALKIILAQNPDDIPALRELAYFYFHQGDWQDAWGIWNKLAHIKGSVATEARLALNTMNSYVPFYGESMSDSVFQSVPRMDSDDALSSRSLPHPTLSNGLSAGSGDVGESVDPADKPRDDEVSIKSHDDVLLNPARILKNSKKLSISSQGLRRLSRQVQTLKEKGYAAIRRGQYPQAIDAFLRAYFLEPSPTTAMQLGYLYDQCNNKPEAYRYFRYATKSQDRKEALCAENALTHLGQLQTKALPAPYFSETFFTPFSQSRFGLTVRPFLARFGMEQNNRLKSREYVLFRRTDDNRSENLGQISQIYEDDVQIVGLGMQIAPWPNLPIVGYVEGGTAYDLIYQNRNRTRGDVRAGMMYYDQFGVPPAYFGQATWGHDYFGDFYADVTYFSRYDNNVIGGARTHHGIRLWQYKSSMINLYATGRVIMDVQRLFYNNFAEVGPGIAYIPTNRFNVQLRFEHLNGMYLPAGAIPNPYGQYYTNNLVQLLVYVKV